MKKQMLLFITLLFSQALFAQSQAADKVLGTWLSENKDGKIEIFKSNNTYYGKLLWGANAFQKDGKTSLKDDKNPDPKLRDRDRIGLVFITGLTYADGEYTGGKLYDVVHGNMYKLKMKLLADGRLEMHGYLGISLIGRSGYWTRIN